MPRPNQTCTVSTREKWADDWEEVAGLYADNFSFVAGPDVSEATLRRTYGRIQRADSTQLETFAPPLTLNGHYIHIELTQTTEDDPDAAVHWYGVVVGTTVDRKGRLSAVSGDTESGEQVFQCRGLEFLLQRKYIDSSFVLNKDSVEVEIGRAIAFNLGPGRENDRDRHGNKSNTVGGRDAYVFAFNIGVGGIVSEGAGTLWSVQDICDYLLKYHPPSNVDGSDRLEWQAADGGDAKILQTIFPSVHAQGKSIKQILDEIIDRRRLVGYTITVLGGKPKINIFTFNKNSVSLPGGTTIPANAQQFAWYFDDDATVQTAVVAEDDATRFDRVTVRGARLGACFTLANTSGATPYNGLVKDWHDTLQSSYNTGASDSGAYSSLKIGDKQSANQAFRNDEQFAKVFRSFIIDPQWNGTVTGTTAVCPDPTTEDGEGNPSNTSTVFWYPGLRLLDWLPLRTDYNYEVVDGFDTETTTIDGSQPNYLRPFAVTKLDGESQYYRLDKIGQAQLNETILKTAGIYWAASLRMQDTCPGLIIDVQGAPQHIIAKDEFTPADTDDENDAEAVIDWKDIAFTVFCEFDQHVEAQWPEGEIDSDADVFRELIIDVPHMRLDYLAPETVIGLDDEGGLVTTDGGYVRDNRALMGDIARCAYEWYGSTRKALTIVRNDLVCDWEVGFLITFIGTESHQVAVNSVVTKVVYDLIARTTTVFSQYAELDPLVAV